MHTGWGDAGERGRCQNSSKNILSLQIRSLFGRQETIDLISFTVKFSAIT